MLSWTTLILLSKGETTVILLKSVMTFGVLFLQQDPAWHLTIAPVTGTSVLRQGR